MDSIEIRLGYKFRNPLLLAEALTHPSLAYESQKAHFDNQRLEFLGDAVLQLALTEHLFRSFPDVTEGRMTKLRAQLVSRNALAQFAVSLRLGNYILLGKGEEASGGRKRASTLADAFEGSDFKRAEKDKDPALARTYPTVEDLLATGEFERLAQTVYLPLKAWAEQAEIEALPDAPHDSEEGELA